MKITNAAIREEVWRQLGWLTQNAPDCSIQVRFYLPDDPNFKGWQVVTKGEITLGFIFNCDDPKNFVVYVCRIGNSIDLDKLPLQPIRGSYRIPDDVFLADDEAFSAAYRDADWVKQNYSLYRELAEQFKPRHILEIGVRAGYSAYQLLSGSPGASYHGIDLDVSRYGGTQGYTARAEAMLRSRFPQSDIRIDCPLDSQTLTELPRRYDLIHVDGAHGHDETVHDLHLAWRHTDRILLDDVTPLTTVASAVVEFLEDCPEAQVTRYETAHGHLLLERPTPWLRERPTR